MVRFPRRNTLLGACLVAALVAAATGWFLIAHSARAVNVDLFGVAIDGYDPVAYFTMGRPVQGARAYEYEWNDATWRFSSARHRDLFARDPARYAPQYGGFCAAGLAMGGKWKADPTVWKIVDDKLFLNYSKSGLEQLTADPATVIEKADETWRAKVPSG